MARTVLIKNGTVIDGTGAKGRRADISIVGDSIAAIGRGVPASADIVLDARDRVVVPGFIDTHSHADGGLLETPNAETQIRQGITTSLVGQDGGSHLPLADWLGQVEKLHVALNIASFVGHGTVRGKVMGQDSKRKATSDEVRQMRDLVATEMKAGALGLSSGLEYDPGLYSDTEEIIQLAQVAGSYRGLYISHVRDEEDDAMASFQEVVRIAREGKLPAQISHIKLGSAKIWGKAKEVFRMMDEERRQGLDITADVYPYTYWQSNLIVLMPPEYAMQAKAPGGTWEDRSGWENALKDIGGAKNILVTGYTPSPSWEGKTIEELAAQEKKEVVPLILEMVTKTNGSIGVVVTAMQESDLKAFIAHPRIMFCTDGGLKGSHPRGAGSYPRILGKYVREERVIPLEEAIRKMTSLPAARMGFRERGAIAIGKKADIVIFDPRTVRDTATTKDPRSAPIGINDVLVNGTPVLQAGRFTGERPGMVLRRA